MVRLKIAYWEFDSEAKCPTLDHDLLSQARILSLFPYFHIPFPSFSPSLISLMVSVDVKHNVYLLTYVLGPCLGWRKFV